MTTPYQAAVLGDGAVSYVTGTDPLPIVDIVQSYTAFPASPGFPAYVTGVAPAGLGGVSGAALQFIRSGGLCTGFGIQNPFRASPATQFSIEMWFNSTDTPGGGGGLGGNADMLNADISGFGLDDWGSTFAGACQVSFGQGTSSGDQQIVSPLGYNDGNWHHFVATWDGTTGAGPNTGTVNLYVDTVLVATATNFRSGTNQGNVVYEVGPNASGINAYMSNWALYPTVLTPTQINNHYGLANFGGIVPNVVGLNQADATTLLTDKQFTLGTVTPVTDPVNPIGIITAQSPVAGSPGTVGEAVNVTTSAGLVVPNVVNTSLEYVAPVILNDAGFVVGVVTYADDVLIIKGNVIKQTPAAGTSANGGSGVNLVVSTGRGGVFVPFIVEDTQTDAMTAITNEGLVVGSITVRESLTIPAGEVIAQNPQGGTPVAAGTLVSFTLSSGPPVPGPAFDWTKTVISQYANSPSLLLLCQSIADNLDPTVNFANFYAFVWNVDTAQGFGLGIWGKIVNVSRYLQIPTGALYVGFQDGSAAGPDPDPGGDYDVQPFSALGTWFTPLSATETYQLEDEPYRQLILAKALANISRSTVPVFNQILQRLFPGRGNPYVVNNGSMNFKYVFDFDLTPIELAILNQSGVMPVPPGVSFTIVEP
jgi:beta-lactam-binding protein with PASTA domain